MEETKVEEVKSETTVESVIAEAEANQTTKKKSRSKKKEQEVDVDVEALIKENTYLKKANDKLTLEVQELIQANTIIVDAQNYDERKKVIDYMQEGRLVKDIKDKPFILAEQFTAIHTIAKPPIHKILLNDILDIVVRKYYTDLSLMEKGSRDLVKTVIWVHHKGYEGHSMITEKDLEYIIDNSFIKESEIVYTHIDLTTREAISMVGNSNEPLLKDVKAAFNKVKTDFEKHNKIGALATDKVEETEKEEVTE